MQIVKDVSSQKVQKVIELQSNSFWDNVEINMVSKT